MEQTHSQEVKSGIAATFLAALKTRDWQLMRTVLTDDVSWTLPGISLLSGEVKGTVAVIDRATRLRDFGVIVEPIHTLYSKSGVALLLHNTASRGALKLDEHVVIAMELRDAKIAGLTTYLHDVPGINNFFVEGII